MGGGLTRERAAGLAEWGLEGAVLVLAFILPFAKTGSIRSVALGVGLFCLVVRTVLCGRSWLRTGGLGLPMALTLLWGGVTLFTAVDPGYSFKGLKGMATYLAMFFLGINAISTVRQVRRVLLALVLGATAMAGGAIREMVLAAPSDAQHMAGRLESLTSDYNFFSTYLVTVLPFLGLRSIVATGWTRWAGYALAGASVAFVYLTYTRAAWIAVMVEAVTLFCLAGRKRGLALALVGLLLVGFASARGVWFRNWGDRLAIWRGGVAVVMDHPLMGIGPGRWSGMRVGGYWPVDPNTHRRLGDHPHNMFLGTAVEMGLPGLAILIWLLSRTALGLWRTAQSLPDGELRLFVLATLLMVVGFIVRNQFDHLYAHSPAQLFWLLVGVALACSQVGQKGSRVPVSMASGSTD